jgi:hypothetical protein
MQCATDWRQTLGPESSIQCDPEGHEVFSLRSSASVRDESTEPQAVLERGLSKGK